LKHLDKSNSWNALNWPLNEGNFLSWNTLTN
jgi:hypothetical protein